ncbi:putative iron-regulated membrane protein [Dongia mobilis]|uniref:Putative iron-regulated membrane protein n=1 Tax=Dongia mobilis TaxID=578943 RepID=A0A4R6WJJ1_9PROT|nr:PepSY domain-containing protein [Dongia mobilis]TDQ80562.1 putative iron-regulated membrane protein [Dongia mobilis]
MSQSTLADRATAPSPLYRAIWRWHFYAGLLVIPFMILLSVTGGIYLLKDELNSLFYSDLLNVEAKAGDYLPPSAIVAAAREARAGMVTAYIAPATPDASAVVTVKTELGKQRVYVDPYSGNVLGSMSDSGFANTPFMKLVRKIHSLDYFGWVANRVIELVAGWAIVLVVSGIYLWWPRGKDVGSFKIRSGAKRRPFWRDLHAVTGLYTGFFIVFLAITGLPWSGFWGDKVNTYANQAGLGYPTGYWEDVPLSTIPMQEAMTQVNWTLENAPMPQSTPTGKAAFGLDQAVAMFDRMGIARGYVVDLPQGPEAVYTASVYPDDIAAERIIHVDQYSGKVLFDAGFADLGPVGQAIEWGVSVHMGQEFGRINQLVMLAACFAIVLMSVSAVVMWWKRRPKGTLGAPRYPSDYRVARGAIIILALLGIAFPLVGLSIIVALALDFLLPRAWRPKVA